MVLARRARRAAPLPNSVRVVAEIFSADISSPDGGENGGPRRDRAVERRTPRIRIGARRSSHTRPVDHGVPAQCSARSEEHTSELQSLMRISYAVFCLKKKINTHHKQTKKFEDKELVHLRAR